MPRKPAKRYLTAILAADVESYSRLMGADEIRGDEDADAARLERQ